MVSEGRQGSPSDAKGRLGSLWDAKGPLLWDAEDRQGSPRVSKGRQGMPRDAKGRLGSPKVAKDRQASSVGRQGEFVRQDFPDLGGKRHL